MDRREFIRTALQASLATAALGSVPVIPLVPARSWAADGPPLAVRRGRDIPALVRETIAALGGIGRFVKSGDSVVVKPNIGWDRPPEMGANTHPLVVRTVIELCLEQGARRVQVFDRTCNEPRRCYVQSGIQGAVEGLRSDRVTIEHMDRRGWQELDIADGVELKRWSFYRPALEADCFIHLPVAKHHTISVLTMGMKNVMGVIGGNRGVLHRHIDEALCDINRIVHSNLTVIDATRILVANGPQGGSLDDVRQTDTLIASPDIVAADSYAATLFGKQPLEIPTLAAAARHGLGTTDLRKVRMV